MPLLLCCISLFIIYALLIFLFTRDWKAIPAFQPVPCEPVQFTVVIPARNEEQNIGTLLTALTKQLHPASYTEIIVVDDESTDHTTSVVRSFQGIKLLQVRHTGKGTAYKKKAIAAAVEAATGEYIVCTDADCIPGPAWLSTLSSFIRDRDAIFVAAPVRYRDDNSLLAVFQSLDFMTLQGITAAAVHRGSLAMSNGANLAYSRKAFREVNGFEGIDHIASGDDMLLMQKIKDRWPEKVHYLRSKEAITETSPMPDWHSFFNQRIRWASKAATFSDWKIKSVLLIVYLFNLCFPVLAVAAFFDPFYALCVTGLWVGKTAVELPFIVSVARFFDRTRLLKYFFFFQPLHILYTLISGLFGQFGKYEWKGRRVR